MRTQYDSAAKHLLIELGEPILKYLLETPDIKVLRRLDTEQQQMWVRRGDSTVRMLINGEEAVAHTEVQLHDSRDKEMHFRLAGYCGYLVSENKMPVYCTVIYLHPRAGRRDPGGYSYAFGDAHHFALRYKVLRLIDIEGVSVLETQEPALLPFTPLMKPPAGMDEEQWLHECVTATAAAPVTDEILADLMALLGVFGSAAYSQEKINRFIRRDLVQNSTYFQSLFAEEREEFMAEANKRVAEALEQAAQAREQAAQAREQGERRGIIDGLMALLGSRFDATAVQVLRPTFENVKELERLKQLLPAAGQAPNLEAFLQNLAEE